MTCTFQVGYLSSHVYPGFGRRHYLYPGKYWGDVPVVPKTWVIRGPYLTYLKFRLGIGGLYLLTYLKLGQGIEIVPRLVPKSGYLFDRDTYTRVSIGAPYVSYLPSTSLVNKRRVECVSFHVSTQSSIRGQHAD